MRGCWSTGFSVPASTSSPSSAASGASSGSDIGLLLGLIGGALAVLVGIISGIWWFCCRKSSRFKRRRRTTPVGPSSSQAAGTAVYPSVVADDVSMSLLSKRPGYLSQAPPENFAVKPDYTYDLGGTSPSNENDATNSLSQFPPLLLWHKRLTHPKYLVNRPPQQRSASQNRTFTYRVESIPGHTVFDEVKDLFSLVDRPRISVKSLAPAQFDGGATRLQTATVEFYTLWGKSSQGPSLLRSSTGVNVDREFNGWTPLSNSEEPIYAE